MQEIQAFHSSKSKLPEPPELPRETWEEEGPVEEREALEFFGSSGVIVTPQIVKLSKSSNLNQVQIKSEFKSMFELMFKSF